MERPPGHLYIGETLDGEGQRTGEPVLVDSADLTTHGVIVGMTGSGKTGLGVVLLEEALLAGIPVLAIDPKGDLGNLCLTFPDLAPGDFEPWIDQGTARVQATSVAELAATTAGRWRDGLASWGLGSDDLTRLRTTSSPTIYTPGSTTGVPIDALGRLTAPVTTDPAARQDEVDSVVTGLLRLIGVDSDPLSGREHVLLANLVARAWDQGTALDLASLLSQVLDPPIRKLGVLDLDTFFPAADRQALVLKLNGLLASPSFAAWASGAPLDMDAMLWTPDGSPRAAIVAVNHLSEAERHFAITLVLSKLVSWMRAQPGTGELRVLVYIDEVVGLAPPVGNPPTKKPILTLLKQARAYGVGLVLSTQNPVDLDYKAISNAGTWLMGRLQTEQDKNRLVDGLRSADGATDVGEVNRIISHLDKRQFVLRTTRSAALPRLTSRWAMSYLAGPLTGDQISTLMADRRAELVPAAAPPAPPPAPGSGEAATTAAGPDGASRPTTTPAPAVAPGAPPPPPGAALADDESTVPPTIPEQLVVRHVAASAPWLDQVGAVPGGLRLEPALAARVQLLFDETKADLRHTQEWEAIIPLDGDRIDVDRATAVDYDDRDFGTEAPEGAVYAIPAADLRPGAIRSVQAALKAKLHTELTMTLLANQELKLWSRPGETREQFAARCAAAAEDGADDAAAALRDKLESRRDRIEAALAKAEDRVNELEVRQKSEREKGLIDLGSSVLGGLLGGRRRSGGLASAARRMSSSRQRKARTEASMDTARNRVAEKVDDLDELEAELAEALIEIDDEWTGRAAQITEVEIPLEKSDITVEDLMLVWLPTDR